MGPRPSTLLLQSLLVLLVRVGARAVFFVVVVVALETREMSMGDGPPPFGLAVRTIVTTMACSHSQTVG